MSEYTIVITKTAQRQLDKLADHLANPLLDAISGLAHNPRPHGYKKLKGRDGYRIRSGDYRIIYEILDKKLTVEVITVGHRKDGYDQVIYSHSPGL
jgi:mRNA interferase RelE/StbE